MGPLVILCIVVSSLLIICIIIAFIVALCKRSESEPLLEDEMVDVESKTAPVMKLAPIKVPEYTPGRRGIIIVAAGYGYYTMAYPLLRALHDLGISEKLTVEFWTHSIPEEAIDAVRHLCIPREIEDLKGKYTLYAHALKHTDLEEVMMIDADTYILKDPSGLFEYKDYQEQRAVFWDWEQSPVSCVSLVDKRAMNIDDFLNYYRKYHSLLVNKRKTILRGAKESYSLLSSYGSAGHDDIMNTQVFQDEKGVHFLMHRNRERWTSITDLGTWETFYDIDSEVPFAQMFGKVERDVYGYLNDLRSRPWYNEWKKREEE